mmetsp:Transcript_50956/g.119462  ORF Transcript_50956/g.119462 Transcript_50956/m.119462 type:complete len:283 (-) Transcript_50956:437-1285(-)
MRGLSHAPCPALPAPRAAAADRRAGVAVAGGPHHHRVPEPGRVRRVGHRRGQRHRCKRGAEVGRGLGPGPEHAAHAAGAGTVDRPAAARLLRRRLAAHTGAGSAVPLGGPDQQRQRRAVCARRRQPADRNPGRPARGGHRGPEGIAAAGLAEGAGPDGLRGQRHRHRSAHAAGGTGGLLGRQRDRRPARGGIGTRAPAAAGRQFQPHRAVSGLPSRAVERAQRAAGGGAGAVAARRRSASPRPALSGAQRPASVQPAGTPPGPRWRGPRPPGPSSRPSWPSH